MGLSAEKLPVRHVEVLGKRMAYTEMGTGDPILLQHGNPTSSYLWRNIMPHLAGLGRCVAVDLIGMGDSDKLDDPGPMTYSFAEHARRLYATWEALGVDRNAVLVIHDWGSALGFNWARLNPDRVQGVAYMEAIVRTVPDWDAWPEPARAIFQAMRSPAGEAIVLEKNVFVERILPSAVLRDLTETEMAVYRAPYLRAGEDRRPTLDWPRQIPIAGEPPEISRIVDEFSRFMSESPLPKLFVNADPGSILTGPQREFCRAWPNQTEVTVWGSHFLQEDSPDEIGAAIADFVRTLRS